jgi:hypothetical protein
MVNLLLALDYVFFLTLLLLAIIDIRFVEALSLSEEHYFMLIYSFFGLFC